MPEMGGGEAVVECLLAAGVEVVFGIPGVHTLEIYDALAVRTGIEHILVRHEQGAGFMADGYARASGRVGVVVAITGPGVTNVATALGEAYADESPLLLVTSEVETRHMGQRRGCLHELRDQLGLTRQLVKWNGCAYRVGDIPWLVRRGLEEAVSGRPGPVHIQGPVDVLQGRGTVDVEPTTALPSQGGDLERVREAVVLLEEARRPLIYAGRGVVWAGATGELVALADALSIPVLTTTLGRDAFPSDHPLSLGGGWRGVEGIREYLEGVDVGLVVGNRLTAIETDDWSMPLPRDLIQIDVGPEGVGRNRPVRVGIVGDLGEVIREMLSEVGLLGVRSREEEAARWREKAIREARERFPGVARLAEGIRRVLPRNAIMSLDATTVGYWMANHFPMYEPRTLLNPRNFLTLGFAFPAALGAKIADPDRAVVSVVGDGGFMFTSQELATAMLHGLSVPVLLFNDSSYGAVKRHQAGRYCGRTIGVDLMNPDFVLFARAFGAEGVRAERLEDVDWMLGEALGRPVPTLIEVPWHLVEGA